LLGLFLGPVIMAALLTIWREWIGGEDWPGLAPDGHHRPGPRQSSHAPSFLRTWLHKVHSKVCRSVPENAGTMRASIIWAWHFGQAGRSIAASGTMDDSSRGWGIMLPSNRRQCNTLDHRAYPEGRAVTRQYAVPATCSLFNIAQSLKLAFVFF
jgi:hypothetical protein